MAKSKDSRAAVIAAVVEASVEALKELIEEKGAALFTAVENLDEQKGVIPLKLIWDLSGDPHSVEADLKHVTKTTIIGTTLRNVEINQEALPGIDDEAKASAPAAKRGRPKKAAPVTEDGEGENVDPLDD